MTASHATGNSAPGGNLAGRRILLTGAASGVGAATARRLAAAGAAVALLDLNGAGLAALGAELGCFQRAIDVADQPAVASAVRDAAASLGGIDGIVNAAGISIFRPFAETDAATWARALAVNLTGPYHVCHAALPFLQAERAATIVNISSAIALQPLANRTAYGASKAGLISFTKVLAMELAPRIRANVICPGAVDTPMVQGTFSDPAALARVTARYALQRIATADEIAASIHFLTGPDSSFITGATLSVDGGRTFY